MIRFVFIIFCVTLFFILSLPVLLYIVLKAKSEPERTALLTQHILCRVAAGIVWLSGAKVTFEGLENIPEDGPALFVGNHRSLFDPLILYAQICRGERPAGFIAKKEWKNIPVAATWMAYAHVLYLDRENIKEGLKTILEAIALVKSGCHMIIYPEGTRGKSADETELGTFHDGSFKIAKKAGCPIVPVVVSNTSAIFENHKPAVRPASVKMRFCPPVRFEELPEDAVKHPGAWFGEYFRNTLSDMQKEA